MPTTLLACPSRTQNAKPEVIIRRTAGFHPSIWGDQFVNYNSDDTITHEGKEQIVMELKEQVGRELIAAASEPSRQLKLIDAVQRLGVAYHFEREIEAALQHFYDTYHDYDDDYNDLHNAALLFRLLRQEGFNVSCDIFNKFKDEQKGKFKETLISDVVSMLGFYEATHLMKHGEYILDEALAFTTTHLSNQLTPQVIYALKQPIRKGLPRLEARRYMSIYQEDGSHSEALLKFAKLDFNLLQSMHKKELSHISRWWKDLNFTAKLPFVRDRVVEGYFWILGVYYEPQYFLARWISTKVIAMASVIDDIYDSYGTLEELQLFTDAIERWDVSCINQLPDYMKLCYEALLGVYEEIEEEMTKQGNSYRVYYAKEAMKQLVRAYFVEAKWFQEEKTPTMEEYMRNALVTSGYYMLATTSFVGLGEIVTKEAFDWVLRDPKIVRASAIIARLMDDMVSHKFEQKRGHVASAIECYMKQYGVSEQHAHDEFQKQVADAWKDINGECLRPTDVPIPLLTRVINLARVIDVIYKSEDGYTHVGKEMKKRIASLLLDPVPV